MAFNPQCIESEVESSNQLYYVDDVIKIRPSNWLANYDVTDTSRLSI